MLTGSLALAFPTVNVIGKIVSMVWEESKILMGISTGKIYIFDCSNGAMSEEDFERSGEELVSFLCFPAKQMRLAIFKSGLLITEKGKMIRMQGSRITEEDLIITSATIHESGALFITSQKGDGLLIFDLNSDRELLIDGITSIGTNVQNISVNYDGNLIALILKDKSIRIIDCNMNFGTESAQVRPRHKLQDVVNRWSWSRAGFSHDGELIWGTFASKDKHQIYIWDAKSGALVKVLEGPKEVLVMAAWNPKRPNIITCGAFGTLFRWVPDYPLKWSPLVPGLEEIEENVIYEEREDEFDFVTIDD
jgi:WD40 repeat protein